MAWLLSVMRVGWQGLFCHIASVYLLTIGLEKQSIGFVTSLGSAGLLTVIFWVWVGRCVGLRALLTKVFALAGFLTVLFAATNGNPLLAACFLIVAAAATSIVDSCGNVPFLSAVRPHERAQMPRVYATHRDISRVASQGVYTLLLSIFPFYRHFYRRWQLDDSVIAVRLEAPAAIRHPQKGSRPHSRFRFPAARLPGSHCRNAGN